MTELANQPANCKRNFATLPQQVNKQSPGGWIPLSEAVSRVILIARSQQINADASLSVAEKLKALVDLVEGTR